MSVIWFYSETDDYGCFSNFSSHEFILNGKHWPTSEHYYQAQKFEGTHLEEVIRLAKSPVDAKRLARTFSSQVREDWGQVKVEVMTEAITEKFASNPEIRETLLSTGDAVLVEHSPKDDFWGDGGDGTGQNMLGLILMSVRADLFSNSTKERTVMRLQIDDPPYKVVTIGSSSRFYGKAREISRILEAHGITCHTPHFDFNETEVKVEPNQKQDLTLNFLKKIENSSILYVVADNGYVGASTTLEVGFAFGQSKKIFSTEPIGEVAVRTLVADAMSVERLIEYINDQSSSYERSSDSTMRAATSQARGYVV
jgi:ribA/ribD-fused uncharacterized protein